MKRNIVVFIILILSGIVVFNSCSPKDTQGPQIHLLDAHGNIMLESQNDTALLLLSKWIDPGILVEDNATKTEYIIYTDDSDEVFTTNSDDYLSRVQSVVITYTATDDAGNISTKGRNVRVVNIAQPVVNSYRTTRTALHISNETEYNSTLAADARIPGRIRFPKVYSHDWDGALTYYRVNADLFEPTNLSTTFSPTIGYMGTKSDANEPFFRNMSYSEGFDTILTITMLKIDAQHYRDTTDNIDKEVYIAGVTDPVNNYPLSRIEYWEGTKTIKRIVLELNVTKNGLVDRVTEVYIPE